MGRIGGMEEEKEEEEGASGGRGRA
jgi:hypothetical protein